VVDKLEKQGREAVLLELGPGRTDQSGDRIAGLELEPAHIATIEQFLDIAGQESERQLDLAEAMLGKREASREGIAELREVQKYLEALEVSRDKLAVDLTIVRGLGYYTGPVFETSLLDLPDYGSVFSGGRYDNLVDRFLNKSIPATGSSIGLDRLLAALIALKTEDWPTVSSQVLVTVMDRERMAEYLGLVKTLRAAGIPSEIYAGDTKNLTKQIRYGDKAGIPFCVIAGSDEFEAGTVTVKNLAAGREKAAATADREEWLKAEDIQETVPADELVAYLKGRLRG